jgi:Zn-finger nucleic acid-binding protein
MSAETLNCPMCGASASSEATKCGHCGARLAAVACPSCFGMIFLGAKFCSHCGGKVNRTEVPTDKVATCPRCKSNLEAVVIGKNNLRECSKCEGIWADADSLSQICADREQQAARFGHGNFLADQSERQPGSRALPSLPGLQGTDASGKLRQLLARDRRRLPAARNVV